jgi:hypothetical protein
MWDGPPLGGAHEEKTPKVRFYFSFSGPGTDVTIYEMFSPKNLAKILAFFAQTIASFCKKNYHNIGF